MTEVLINQSIEASDIAYFVFWKSISGFIGLLIAFIISLTISIKRHWFWFNAVIAFILTYSLFKIGLLDLIQLRQFILHSAKEFDKSILVFLADGVIFLTIGLLIFLTGQSNQFIEKTYRS